jgi:hypothetical protein
MQSCTVPGKKLFPKKRPARFTFFWAIQGLGFRV